jgi:hypothetical protein
MVNVLLRQDSTGANPGDAATGLTPTNVHWSYALDGASSVAHGTCTSGTAGTYASGSIIEIDSTNMPGVYQFGIPNAALASGLGSVIKLTCTGVIDAKVGVSLVAWSPLTFKESSIATATLTDTGDNTTAGSPGYALANLGTTSSFVTALMTDTTASDSATPGSPGYWLKYLGGALSAGTSIFTNTALANAPTGSGGGTSVVAAPLTNHIIRNMAGQGVVFQALLSSGAPDDSDAANITAKISLDGATANTSSTAHPTWLGAGGLYYLPLSQAETAAARILLIIPASSTSGVTISPVQPVLGG